MLPATSCLTNTRSIRFYFLFLFFSPSFHPALIASASLGHRRRPRRSRRRVMTNATDRRCRARNETPRPKVDAFRSFSRGSFQVPTRFFLARVFIASQKINRTTFIACWTVCFKHTKKKQRTVKLVAVKFYSARGQP